MKTRIIAVWLYTCGCFNLVFHAACADLFQQEEHGRRVKRFLFNKVNEPNITYGPVTLCCECDDFDESNSCHKNCRTGSGYGSMKPCMGQLCSTTATLINDRFYIVSGCASEKICQDERNVYDQTKGCQTMLKEEMSNGTKCGYCCRDQDLTVHGTSHNSNCLNNLDKLVSHAYSQNIMASTTTTTTATTTKAAAAATTTSTTLTSEKSTTTDAIYKTASTESLSSKEVEQICKARTDSKKYFPYPGDETKFIQCGDFGAYTILHCPHKTVWFDEAETCNFGHNHITRQVSTKAVTSLLKTTLQRNSELTAFSRDTITTPSPGALTTSSGALTTSSGALTASSGVTCHTCTDDKHCRIEPCQLTDAYCLNVVQVYANGSQTVAKKSCASFYECKFDHSLRSSQCDTTKQSSNVSVSSKAVLCQYCCKASDSTSPCNIHNIPDKIDWFQVGKRKKRNTDRQWLEVKSKMIVMVGPGDDQEPLDYMGPTSPSYLNISTMPSHPTAAATTPHPAGALAASKVVEKHENSTKKVRQTTVYPKVATPSKMNDQIQTTVDLKVTTPSRINDQQQTTVYPKVLTTRRMNEQQQTTVDLKVANPSRMNDQQQTTVYPKVTTPSRMNDQQQTTVYPKVTTPSQSNDLQENLSKDRISEEHDTEAVMEHSEEYENVAEVGNDGRVAEKGESGTNATFNRLVMGKSFAPNFHISINGLLVNAIVSFLLICLF